MAHHGGRLFHNPPVPAPLTVVTRMTRRYATILLAGLLCAGCADDPAPGSPDAGAPAAADAGASCEPDRLENVIENRPIQEGDYCDDIQLCARDAAAAGAVMALEPGFECGAEQAGCAAGEVHCSWNTPDTIDAADYAALCDISTADVAPTLRCWVYL